MAERVFVDYNCNRKYKPESFKHHEIGEVDQKL